MSIYSSQGLQLLQNFIYRECIWIRGRIENKYREYKCTASLSTRFIPALPHLERFWYYNVIVVILKHRDYGYILNIAINGNHYAQLGAKKVSVSRYFGMPSPMFYRLHVQDISKADLTFIPRYDFSPSSDITLNGLTVYDHCTVVTKTLDVNSKTIIPIGKCGIWCVRFKDRYTLYMFTLKYDLGVVCWPHSTVFPSLSHLLIEANGCDSDMCGFCRGHEKHVDVFNAAPGVSRNFQTCFCGVPCEKAPWTIKDSQFKPLFAQQEIERLMYRHDKINGKVLQPDINMYFEATDAKGNIIPLENNNWTLLRLDPRLSYMIIVACPVLKRLCFS